jgi:hypothetical protein
MPAIWTFPASCSMVQSASSPLPWLDLSPDWPRLRATLQAGRLDHQACPRHATGAGCERESTLVP